MPLDLTKNRRWALLLSGVFLGSFLGNIGLFVWNSQLTTGQITPLHQQYALTALFSFVIAYFLYKFAMEKIALVAREKPRTRTRHKTTHRVRQATKKRR